MISGWVKSLLVAGGVLAATLLIPFGWVLLWVGFDPDPDRNERRQDGRRSVRWRFTFTTPRIACPHNRPKPESDMNAQFNRLAPAEVVGESATHAAIATAWGLKEVAVGSIAIVLLVIGVYIASFPAQIPYDEIASDTEVLPFSGITTTAVSFFTVASTIVLTAMAAVAAVIAWVVLKIGNMPRGLIVPIAIATYLIVAAAPFVANSDFEYAAATIVIPSLAVYGLCAYLIIIVARQRGGSLVQAANGLKLRLPSKLSHYAIAIGIYAAAYVAVTIWSLGIDFLDVPDWIKVPDNATDILETAGLPLTIITVAVLAPIGEEIVFRGFALPGLASRLGATFAILITSAVFALIHLGPGIGVGILPVTFILGLAFAFVYHKTKSLILAIATHALHNAITIIALAATDTVA